MEWHDGPSGQAVGDQADVDLFHPRTQVSRRSRVPYAYDPEQAAATGTLMPRIENVESALETCLVAGDSESQRRQAENILILLQQVAAAVDPEQKPPSLQSLTSETFRDHRFRFSLLLARYLHARSSPTCQAAGFEALQEPIHIEAFMRGLLDVMTSSCSRHERLVGESLTIAQKVLATFPKTLVVNS